MYTFCKRYTCVQKIVTLGDPQYLWVETAGEEDDTNQAAVS